MKETCCYQASLEKLSELWDQKYKVYLEYNYEYFRYFLIEIMSKHKRIKRAAMQVHHMDRNHLCKKAAEKILGTEFEKEELKILKRTINNLKKHDMTIK